VSRWSVARDRREASTAGTREVGTIRSSWSWTRRERGRGTSFAKAGGGRRNGPRRGCARERRKTGAGAITGKASTRERRKTSTVAWPSFRDEARSSGNLRSIARCEGDERASFEHPQGCERHAKHIAASRAPHRKMHEAATPRALPPKRWIRRKVESSRLRSLIDAPKGVLRQRVSDPQLGHRKVIDPPGYCTRTASLTCPGELGGWVPRSCFAMVEVERRRRWRPTERVTS
jgi:hypothetical protein